MTTNSHSYEKELYKGIVTTKQEIPIQNVSITLCYVGWYFDWSISKGINLTWDHLYCSKPVITNKLGKYEIYFAGPKDTYIVAKSLNWIQTKHFSAKEGKIVLLSRNEYYKNLLQRQYQNKQNFYQKDSDQTISEFYSHIILDKQRRIKLIYHGNSVEILNTALINENGITIALKGNYTTIKNIAKEINIKKFNVSFVKTYKDKQQHLYLLYYKIPKIIVPQKIKTLTIVIPSIKASFSMKVLAY